MALRCPIVCVLGHVDHGKCLLPDERVFTENGIIEIKELFETARETVEKDSKKEIKKLDIKVFGIDDDGISLIKASHVWRLRHKGKMIKVKLKNSLCITTTPEHPFLTNIGWLPAEELRDNLKIAVPKKGKNSSIEPRDIVELGKTLLGINVEEDLT